jgi:hypothetical protein
MFLPRPDKKGPLIVLEDVYGRQIKSKGSIKSEN